MATLIGITNTGVFDPGFDFSSFWQGIESSGSQALTLLDQLPEPTSYEPYAGGYSLNFSDGTNIWFAGSIGPDRITIREFDLDSGTLDLGFRGRFTLRADQVSFPPITVKEAWLGDVGGYELDFRGSLGVTDTGISGSVKEFYMLSANGSGPGGFDYVRFTGQVSMNSQGDIWGGKIKGVEWGQVNFVDGQLADPVVSGKVTGANIDAVALGGALDSQGFDGLMPFVTTGSDKITGTAGGDFLDGGAGNDKIYGEAGDDTIFGNTGNDQLFGGDGNDTIDGGAGQDKINDLSGNNTISDLEGNARITTGAGHDEIVTGAGNDKIVAGDGDNSIDTGAGNDNITTGSGNDSILAGAGNDRINSGAGDDDILAGSGNDKVVAGAGADRIDGGEGADVLSGGSDNDIFVFSNLAVGGIDRIQDFAKGDILALDTSVFTQLAGAAVENLTLGSAAADGDDYLVYNAATGALYYDADGSGADAAIQIAGIKGEGAKLIAFDDFQFA
ncbi:hypothetical protein KRX52_10580 [Pseudomonas sp. MAP12]|uniref:Calcium-binding protein n=1 Tax=Geopseudomonas aromaticivorans TaxID=2849492 RepID=A0ABS6MWR0_9GAMM|nr:calcium-binding protein [Pseudomonas aromaticivorans]MBV2133243.1 hypothetical protein [Pseudomonas aromaticivorans]